MMFKKGNVKDVPIVAIVVGISVSIMVLIFMYVLSGNVWQLSESDIDSISTTSVVNEVFLANNLSAETLNFNPVQRGTVSFSKSGSTVLTTNFTINYASGTVLLTGDTGLNNTNVNISYSYGNETIKNKVKQSGISGFQGLEQTGKFIPLIVLAIFIVIILGVVIMSAGKATGGKNFSL